jgi:uncharacterized protein (TIGR02611 family)
MKNPSPAKENPAGFNARFNRGLSRVLSFLKVQDVPHLKRIIVTVLGGSVLIFGVALVFLPGPGALVILGGLALLGTEYAWARYLLRKGRQLASQARSRTQRIVSWHREPAEKQALAANPEPVTAVAPAPAAPAAPGSEPGHLGTGL